MIIVIRKKNGFTLVELLATLVILGIVLTLVIVSVNANFDNAKKKTQDVFIKTIEDALSIYLDSDAKNLTYTQSVRTIKKSHGNATLYKASQNLTFKNVINSSFSPITTADLVNPANEKVKCNENAKIEIYRDSDYIYYYKVAKSAFNCLVVESGDSQDITNLPD